MIIGHNIQNNNKSISFRFHDCDKSYNFLRMFNYLIHYFSLERIKKEVWKMITLFLLFLIYGYPSDTIVIPMTILLVGLAIKNTIGGIKDEKNYR